MTYADQRTVTFDFSNPSAYGYNKPADGAGTPLAVGGTIVSDGVTITNHITAPNDNAVRYYTPTGTSAGVTTFRLESGGSVSITAGNNNIVGITLSGTNCTYDTNFTSSVQGWNGSVWNGFAKSVDIVREDKTITLSAMTVVYETGEGGGVTAAEPEIYTAISWDGATYTVSDEFKAVANAESTNGGIATNAENGMSVVKFGTASVSVEAVSGSTPKNVTETEYGVFPGWAEWYDVKWDWRNQGDISFGYIVGTGNPAVGMNPEAVTSYDVPTDVWRPAYTFYEADGSKGMPVMGLYYKFTIKKTGLLKIGVWSNKGNRQTFIVDEATKTPIKMRAEGYINGQNYTADNAPSEDLVGKKKFLSTDEIQALHDAAKVDPATGVDSAPYVIGAGNQPFWGNLIAEVEAGKTYWLFQPSSQIGFAGYEFEPLNESEPIKSNVIYYTSSDRQVITPYNSNAFGAVIISNTYENGQGVITFDRNVSSIGKYAFYGCTGLTSITIPSSVISIGESAFYA